MQYRSALITGSWRCGSTALNRSLMQHPGIFGWIEETSFCKLNVPPAGWQEGQWVIQKNPQYAPIISKIVQQCPPTRVIVLTRNPYAICRSLLEALFSTTIAGGTIENACAHILAYYSPLIMQEAVTPSLFFRVRYEDIVKDPRNRLTELLREVFGLPFDEHCLVWEKKSVRLGYGDPKASDTIGWKHEGVDAWRAGLSHAQKAHVLKTCIDLFRALNYDPNDA
jgi:hypothetical protein